MILSLRRRHRTIMLALSIVVPATFAAGLAARKSVPAVPALPAQIVGEQTHFDLVRWVRNDLWTNGIRTTLLADKATPFQMAILLSAKAPIARPDVIVYWVPTNQAITDKLPEEAVLLGKFASTPLRVPEKARDSNGMLVLYSLADQEVVAVSKPFSLYSQPSTIN